MDKIKIQKMKSIVHDFEQLYKKMKLHFESEQYIYPNQYNGWVNDFNITIRKYNTLTSATISERTLGKGNLSATGKTVQPQVAHAFAESIKDLCDKISEEIEEEKNEAYPMLPHQMRLCFKIQKNGCPLNPAEIKNKVFVAVPFHDDYKNSYEYGIKLALESVGMDFYRADNKISNKDIWCKICNEIQTCGIFLANISGLNPNVMLELGLAYGLGKKVVLVKDTDTKTVSDLGAIEYIEYAHEGELQVKLRQFLQGI
jgi:hypothetical protein